jgi:mannose-6-phosphate isomerase
LKTDTILRLHNRVRSYAWGSRTAIAEILGEPASSVPQAELWMGAHPRAASSVRTSGGEIGLNDWIARDPRATLGADVAARFEGKLPFLFKILAAEQPLSIQAHPGVAQARAGFERENRAGIALDAPERSYPDPYAKSEMICALTPFRALNRFRAPEEIAKRFAPIAAPELERELAALRGDGKAGLEAFVAALLNLADEQRGALLSRAIPSAREARDPGPEGRLLLELEAAYPGDVGVLAPLFLNVVDLAPGEAMFLPPGELHAYVSGTGLELMSNSDNVLRGGLTSKHVDVPELLSALAWRTGPVDTLRPRPDASGAARCETGASEFALSLIDTRETGGYASRAEHGVEILLCTEGTCELSAGDQEPIRVARGDSLFVPASAPDYRVAGRAVLYGACVPHV